MQPLYDNLLVRRIYDAPPTCSQFSIPGVHQTLDGRWLKNSRRKGPAQGEVVVAVGKGDKYLHKNVRTMDRIPMDVRVGDTIIYPRFESSHVQIGGEMLTFVHEADVMAVIEP